MEMKYLINFPIGDWSRDGHGHCDWYLVESNKPVEEVREIHFLAKEKLDIEEIASEYKDNKIFEKIKNEVKLIGLDIDKYIYEEYKEEYYIDSEGMINLWIDLLMNTESTLSLSIKEIPTINFYGYDEQTRHISSVGYGCFWG